MEFHYVVAFNTNTNKWSVEDETHFLDGNVWNPDDQEWYWASNELMPNSELIDERCHNMLNALVSIWPAVDTNGY